MTVYRWFNEWYKLGGNGPWVHALIEALEEQAYAPYGLA